MAIQTIGAGQAPNDGTGDTPRAAMQKANANFAELDTRTAAAQSAANDADAAAEAAQNAADAAATAAAAAQDTADGAVVAADAAQTSADAAAAAASAANANANSRIPSSQKGASNGVASLDGNGRLVQPAWGMGLEALPLWPYADMETIPESSLPASVWRFNSSGQANLPPPSSSTIWIGMWCPVTSGGTGGTLWMYPTTGSGNAVYRNVNNGAWGAWRSGTTVVGTAVSGLGVGGAIIENGGSGTDRYVRFANGTVLMSGQLSGIDLTVESGGGAMYRCEPMQFTLPSSLAANTDAVGYCVDSLNTIAWGSVRPNTSTTAQLCLIYPSSSLTGRTARWEIIGRWF